MDTWTPLHIKRIDLRYSISDLLIRLAVFNESPKPRLREHIFECSGKAFLSIAGFSVLYLLASEAPRFSISKNPKKNFKPGHFKAKLSIKIDTPNV